jgi:predicted aconitase with swiveling domain
MMSATVGRCLVPGQATGEVLYTDVPLSFWMGIDTNTGEIIDRHHPLCGQVVTGKIFVLPGGRGSCSGSCGLLELIMNDRAPAALIFENDEPVLTLGTLIASEIFGRSIPLASVGPTWFSRLATAKSLEIADGRIAADGTEPIAFAVSPSAASASTLNLTDADKAMLEGAEGQARQAAMRVILRFAELQGRQSSSTLRKLT